MNLRRPLRRQLTQAWTQTIQSHYESQQINSEHALQVLFCMSLSALLPPNRRVFIEPKLLVVGETPELRYPDLAICNSREIIGFVELKYTPRMAPQWQKDIATLEWIDEHREVVQIRNERFRGVEDPLPTYPVARDALYVWAGVHAACDIELCDHIRPDLRSRFLELHAETQRSEPIRLR